MISLLKKPGDRILELGGGDNPNPATDVNIDVRPGPKVHFTANFEEPLPIKDQDFDGVFSHFAFEHVSWRKVPQLVTETFRVLRPGGRVCIVVPNTEAQLGFIRDYPDGWDGKGDFESFSCVLFGDQDYQENAHRSFWSPSIASELFGKVGFVDVQIQPYGDRQTDMVVIATKPRHDIVEHNGEVSKESPAESGEPVTSPIVLVKDPHLDLKPLSREEMFDKAYFNGGHKVGGYASDQWGAYRDFPVHEITFRHVLARRPKSVLELGCARGYILKRLQDVGIDSQGLEISRHCYLTRVCNGISNKDFCQDPWFAHGITGETKVDLCFSMAVLEHVPEDVLPRVIKEMAWSCRRGLHGIDFGEHDDGFDLTHCTLKPRDWWVKKFEEYAPGWPVEIVSKEDLESGQMPFDVLKGDGKVKLNIGSFTTMFHHGWTNIDIHDLTQYAQQNGYQFQKLDVRGGLPYDTGSVDLIFMCHFLEHLTYDDGLRFLRECRRVIKKTGGMRIIVPDTRILCDLYRGTSTVHSGGISALDEISDTSSGRKSGVAKFWELLFGGHQSAYDDSALVEVLEEAGFYARSAHFRCYEFFCVEQILKETLDMLPCLSLYVDAVTSAPVTGLNYD